MTSAASAPSAESCIRKAVAERGLTPGPVGLADAKAEDEDGAGERVMLERLLAEPGQAVVAPPEIGRLDGDQDLHMGRDLEHHRASQKLRDKASTSAAS